MGMRLQDAINFALANQAAPFGLDTLIEVTMHDETDTVLVGGDTTKATFRRDVPLLNWRMGTISPVVGRPTGQIPGFSTRGQGGLMMDVVAATAVPLATPTPIDVSVRRDPGIPILRFLGSGPSVQIEIEKLTALGGRRRLESHFRRRRMGRCYALSARACEIRHSRLLYGHADGLGENRVTVATALRPLS
jgi:hypothetical protein